LSKLKALKFEDIKAGKLYSNAREEIYLCLAGNNYQIKWLKLAENIITTQYSTYNYGAPFWLRELSCDEDAEYGG
jgi:hypothetical protein